MFVVSPLAAAGVDSRGHGCLRERGRHSLFSTSFCCTELFSLCPCLVYSEGPIASVVSSALCDGESATKKLKFERRLGYPVTVPLRPRIVLVLDAPRGSDFDHYQK